MKFISLQHISIEDPGTFKDFLIEDGHSITTIQLDEGDSIPNNLDEFDAMLCMGGPMDTFMEDQYPWLVAEKKAIGEYVLNLKKPFLGFCLGCQLLGEVLGGKVVESKPPEIGVLDINIEEASKADNIFDFLPKYQIFGYDKYAYGIQFHLEIRKTTVDDWAQVPEYKNALEKSLGADALPQMKDMVAKEIDTMVMQCNQMYKNFVKIINN